MAHLSVPEKIFQTEQLPSDPAVMMNLLEAVTSKMSEKCPILMDTLTVKLLLSLGSVQRIILPPQQPAAIQYSVVPYRKDIQVISFSLEGKS